MVTADGRKRAALSASRALGVLNYFTANPRGSYTLAELSADLDVSPASMLAVLRALTESGYLVRHPRHKTYDLGPALVAAGHAALLRHPVVGLARPEMARLAEQWGECVGSVVVGQEILILAVEGRPTAQSHDLWLGQRLPFVPPLGQVYLAWSPQAQVDAWLARGGHDVGDGERADAEAMMAPVRARGYVVGLVGERSQEVELLLGQLARRPLDVALRARLADLTDLEDTSARVDAEPDRTYHVSNLQAPVFDADGGVALALTLPGLFLELTGHEIAKLGGELTAAARMLTRQLSGRAPAMPGIGVSA